MLDNNIAIVTGAGNGMGEAHARTLAERGATVIVTDLDAKAGDRVASEIRQQGRQAEFFSHDVRDFDNWNAIVSEVMARHGKIDTLVNNAGVLNRKPIEEMSEAEFDFLMSVNVKGTFLGCKAVIPAMKAAGGGSIINVASISGLVANMPGMIAYSSSKGAIRMLTKAAAVDLACYNIRVNSVHPGTIRTPMTAGYYDDPEMRKLILGTTILARPGEPKEVSQAICFLASAESSYMTGSDMVVDGGFTAA